MHLEKRILVTGGAGFLGSHLCARLIAEGAQVLCVDNFFTGARRNVEPLLDHKHFELIRHDVTFPLFVEVDEIYNLACPASPVHYQHDPVQTIKTSVHGAINMLGLAKRVNAKILQASTSEVYGDPSVHPQTEDYWGNVNPIGLRSCYDEASVARRACSSPIGTSAIWASRSPVSSTPMGHACIPTTDASFRISLCRRCLAATSRSTVKARKLARSATWTTSSMGS